MDAGLGGFPPLFAVMFVVVGLIVAGVFVMALVGAVRSRKVLRDSGLDPLAAHAQIAARFAQGPLATPEKTLEQRLTELDDLHRRGVISAEEHAAARTAALRGE